MARFFKVQQGENSLLEYEEFVLRIKFIILNAKEKYKDVTDVTIFWEMVKMEISLGFSLFDQPKKKGAKDKRNTELELLRKLENLNAQTDGSPNDDHLVSESRTLKIKFDQIAKQKTKSSIVRSIRWYESGEKCNTMLFKSWQKAYDKIEIC